MAILAAVDIEHTPQQPISVGYNLATAYDETLVLVYVITEEEFEQRRNERDELPEEFQTEYTLENATEEAANQVADAADTALDTYDSERIMMRGRVGTPSDEILAVAEEIDPRFVVVGGRRRSLARQTLFGSISQAIVRDAEQPVVTIMENPD